MLPRIKTTEAFTRFQEIFRTHNDQCEWHKHERTLPDGRVVEVSRQRGTMKEAVKTSFYGILTQYVNSYNRIAATMPAGMYTVDDLPGLFTNGVRLAKFLDCSDRTVRNHVERLKTLGAVSTRFRGSGVDYELWISPEILFGEAWKSENEKSENTPSRLLNRTGGKIFPHTDTQIQNSEKEKKDMDMLVSHGENDHGERGRAASPAAVDLPPKSLPGSGAQREGAGGGRRAAIAAHNAQLRQEKAQAWLDTLQSPTPRGLDARYVQMLMEFWLHAWKILYQKRDFSSHEQGQAIAAIAAGVYNNFVDERTPRQWADYQVYQLTKLDKACKYYDHHPTAYLPDPYAVHVPGRGYFDAENLKGFTGIDAWMQKDTLASHKRKLDYQQKKEEKIKRCEALLRTARRDFEKLRAELPPRKAVQSKTTQIGLFQHYRAVFEGQGKAWLRKFIDQYTEQSQRNFQPPAYHRIRRKRAQAGEPLPEVIIVEDWMTEGEGWYSEF